MSDRDKQLEQIKEWAVGLEILALKIQQRIDQIFDEALPISDPVKDVKRFADSGVVLGGTTTKGEMVTLIEFYCKRHKAVTKIVGDQELTQDLSEGGSRCDCWREPEKKKGPEFL